MADKPRPTLADYVVTALSPALIAGLVGSLVFFLVEILYAGKYENRLLWSLFFFVCGIVLVARISIDVDQGRAAIYGLGLAVVFWLALSAYVDYPKDSPAAPYAGFINALLMAMIWWSAHKLTWDCTFIDEKRPSSSQGLLAAAGLEKREVVEGRTGDERHLNEDAVEERPSLLNRWERHRERRKKRPHTPGLTVVWFSLAALPIFGLGQSLIPAGDSARRTHTFWLAVCYVGCALGLLLTTSFLGMRRYLRQRKLPMPKAMTSIWLGLGGVLVVAFLVVGALIPRPYSESPLWDLKRLRSTDQQAAKKAPLDDSTGKGESEAKNADNGKKDDGAQQTKQGSGEKGSQSSNEKGSTDEGEGEGESEGERRFPDTKLGNILEKLLTFLKWLVFNLLALLVLALLFRGGLSYLANFMPGARRWLDDLANWWNRLFARSPTTETIIIEPKKPKRHPFAFFSNPFNDGTSDGRSVEDLVAYSFQAMEAWAGDRLHPRRRDETALEFASRLSNTFPSLEGSAPKLAVLVAQLAYAPGPLPKDARPTLEHVWNRLSTTMPANPENPEPPP